MGKSMDIIGKLPTSLMPKEKPEAVKLCRFCGAREVTYHFSTCDVCWEELTPGMKYVLEG